jgi:hypothetical protein
MDAHRLAPYKGGRSAAVAAHNEKEGETRKSVSHRAALDKRGEWLEF